MNPINENQEVTISIKEMGGIVCNCTHNVLQAAERANAGEQTKELLKELLLMFSADIMAKMFKEDTLEVI